ncbi:hypothetical protein [Frigoribacterium salinisoli]
MIEWQPVAGSSRKVAEAFVAELETILVRFPNGKEWAYSACSQYVWEQFTAPVQFRGQYIAEVLNAKPH